MALDRLGPLPWARDAAYRSLAYRFRLRSTAFPAAEEAHRLLAPFHRAPTEREAWRWRVIEEPPVYSLVDLGPDERRRYRVYCDQGEVMWAFEPRRVLDHVLWHVGVRTHRRTGDFFLVHAGAVVAPSGAGVLLPATAGSGKTTLVAGLVRAGYGYLSDEAAAIDPVGRAVHPYPRPLTLKVGAFPLFRELWPGTWPPPPRQYRWHLLADELRPGATGEPAPVRTVVLPRYEPGAATRLEPLARAEAGLEMVRNAMNLTLYAERGLRLLSEVLAGARCWRLVSSDLSEAVQAVGDAVAAGGSD